MITTRIVPFAFLLVVACSSVWAQEEKESKLKPEYYEINSFVDENEACLKCHGEAKYSYASEDWGKTITKAMYPSLMVDRDAYYSGVHASFMCSDCHMGDFSEFPHSIDARMEDHLACMDCHGYDETYAQYHFETIDEEVTASIHNIKGFSCWKCHDPHSYHPNMRGTENIKDAIQFNNNMCLECHMDYNNFNVFSEREEINLVESHDWLPNQVAHLRSIRCIECHTEINDSILVAHKILPKSEAVQNCTECHSSDSRLMHSLYKFQVQKGRRGGFMNGVILNDTFVIGANSSPFLEWVSILFFIFTLFGIAIHVVFRIIKLRN